MTRPTGNEPSMKVNITGIQLNRLACTGSGGGRAGGALAEGTLHPARSCGLGLCLPDIERRDHRFHLAATTTPHRAAQLGKRGDDGRCVLLFYFFKGYFQKYTIVKKI